MSPEFRRFLLVLGTCTGLAAAFRFAAAPAVKSYLSYQATCSQPCPEGLGCQPLALTLELARPLAKLGRPYPLWYKVKLVNQSCFKINVNGAGFFMGGFSTLSLAVIDPQGNPVKEEYFRDSSQTKAREPFKMAPYGVAFGSVSPYLRDMTEFNRLRALKRVDEHGFIELEPGETLATQSLVLAPHREAMIEQFYPDGRRGTATTRVSVPTPSWVETPLPGFDGLDNYVFHRPGRYSIFATYSGKPYGVRELPRLKALPRIFVRFLGWIEDYLEIEVVPESGSRDLRIEAVSNKIAFEVRP